MTSPQDILGVSYNASIKEIRIAYKKKAKELHPDVNNSADAHAQFILLQKAYEFLMNPSQTTDAFQQAGYRDPFEVYLEKMEAVKARILEEEKLKEATFQVSKEKFKLSPYYTSGKILLYTATAFSYLFSLFILMTCAYIIITIHALLFFILIPFISMAIYFLRMTGRWYKDRRRYFE